MDKFLETCNLPKLNEREAGSLNRSITVSKMEAVIKKLVAHKSAELDGFTEEFHKTFKEELILIFLRLLQKIQEEGRLPNSFIKPASSQSQNQIKTQQRKKITGPYR